MFDEFTQRVIFCQNSPFTFTKGDLSALDLAENEYICTLKRP